MELILPRLFADLPEHLGGLLTYEGFIARMVTVLRKFEISAHHERIRAHFAHADPAIRDEIARLLER